ncbi:M48 family metallopeptidase [Thalassomonas sp. M1454]|uniref:M48 metallopeptidase family protein n=1 Tax=Thalassomonas sp. M1454 TaxID=2594477 RepID=UPI00117F0052|nr:M48 family metallopeptidase [Thalassomonas sp. M1454]TRX54455.1 M48 family metallopeptidase [Thalassomonas sp. M1454]
MTVSLKYLSAYSPNVIAQVQTLIDEKRLDKFLLKKYPKTHGIGNDNQLREFVLDLKNQYLRKSAPLSKIAFDNKIHVINNALGLHTYVSRVQGSKLKSKNELRVAALFKNTPIEFLTMIVVHELAHLKEKDHNKAFYKLCQHMMPNYHQVEFELRLYLTQIEFIGEIY